MYNSLIFNRLIENNKAKLEEKIRKILEIIDEGIAHDNLPDDEPPAPVDSNKLKKRIAQINPENLLSVRKGFHLFERWNPWFYVTGLPFHGLIENVGEYFS
jgi:hypothetical protein